MSNHIYSKHIYDRADGGICVKCNQCQYPKCCEQTVECSEIYGLGNSLGRLRDNKFLTCEGCDIHYYMTLDWADECYCFTCYHDRFPCPCGEPDEN